MPQRIETVEIGLQSWQLDRIQEVGQALADFATELDSRTFVSDVVDLFINAKAAELKGAARFLGTFNEDIRNGHPVRASRAYRLAGKIKVTTGVFYDLSTGSTLGGNDWLLTNALTEAISRRHKDGAPIWDLRDWTYHLQQDRQVKFVLSDSPDQPEAA